MTFTAATSSAQSRLATMRALPAATPTLDKPQLYVNSNIQCRTGTRANYKVVATFSVGTIVDMVGKDTAEGAWLVVIPNSKSTCWVQAQDSTPSGDFQALPEVHPKLTTQQLPPAPTDFTWPFFCTYVQGVLYKVTIKLSWIDTAADVNGYRVYRGNTLVADQSADVRTFCETTEVTIGTNLVYGVEAYNDAGVSPRHILTIASICK